MDEVELFFINSCWIIPFAVGVIWSWYVLLVTKFGLPCGWLTSFERRRTNLYGPKLAFGPGDSIGGSTFSGETGKPFWNSGDKVGNDVTCRVGGSVLTVIGIWNFGGDSTL